MNIPSVQKSTGLNGAAEASGTAITAQSRINGTFEHKTALGEVDQYLLLVASEDVGWAVEHRYRNTINTCYVGVVGAPMT